jgi:hypothetical protein
MSKINRRTVLAGAAATAVASAFPSLSTHGAPSEPQSPIVTFFLPLSAALTGIDASRLAPNVDPADVVSAYFFKAQSTELLKVRMAQLRSIFDREMANKTTLPQIADIVLNTAGEEMSFYVRSIMLMWYLGAWYEPDTLKDYARAGTTHRFPAPYQVLTATTYTQGWAWRVAQAHPMGYSQGIFGYWNTRPLPLAEYINAHPGA